MTSNEETLRKRLNALQEKHSDKADSFTVKLFKEEDIPCYQILRQKEKKMESQSRVKDRTAVEDL